VSTASGSVANNRKFLTKEQDATGLIYFGKRYYNPRIGRFISQDPSGIVGGLNLYLYCKNDPVNFVDLWGLYPEKANPWWLTIGLGTLVSPFPGDETVYWTGVAIVGVSIYVINQVKISDITNSFRRNSDSMIELTGYHAGDLSGRFDVGRSSWGNRYGPALYTSSTVSGAIAEKPNQPHLDKYRFNVQSSKVWNVSSLSENKIINSGIRILATVTGKQVISYPSRKNVGTNNYAVIDGNLAISTVPERIY
jgi:RHS repeat-associated protein